jgi:O-sialoglycoprotein endopeptidase (EC 3.4.24.57)
VAAALELVDPPGCRNSIEGDAGKARFPRARVGDGLDFSFSGLKTAVVRYLQARPEDVTLADVAAGLQEAIVDVLVTNTLRAAEACGVEWVAVGGGVAANSLLKQRMRERCEERGLRLAIPPPRLCNQAYRYRRPRGGARYQLLFPLVRVNFELGVIMVIAVSCVKLLSAHNSTQHTSRKHKV